MVLGGLSNDNDVNIMEKVSGCIKAALKAYDGLINNKNSDGAVVDAIQWLENDEFFNCGYGSFANNENIIEMDASLINGTKFKSGTVLSIKNIEHPILIAKKVMDSLPNCIVTDEIIKSWNKNILTLTPGNMISNYSNENFDVINSNPGCVVWDGINMSAGTSSGGRKKKYPGTVSCTIGSSIFATQSASCILTGANDQLYKTTLARDIVDDITENGSCCDVILQKFIDNTSKKYNINIGGIILQSNGCYSVYFTSSLMPYAIIRDDLIEYGWKSGDTRYEKIHNYMKNSSCYCN